MSGFKMLSEQQRALLEKAQKQYQTSLHLAAGFLSGRGISMDVARKWGLGVVESPVVSHECMRTRLAIPYYDQRGPVTMQFRCIHEHICKDTKHKKYLFPEKGKHCLFNLPALDTSKREIHVTEGAFDAIILSEVLAVPVVGVPGASSWHPHWAAHFTDFDRVALWRHGDDAGKTMAKQWAQRVGADVIELPDEEDVNSVYLEHGADILRKLNEEG